MYDLLGIEKPEGKYLVLETTLSNTKIVYVISLQKKNISIGRGNDADVRLTEDISVSLLHATIRVTKTGIYLKDNDSKFGTLVKFKELVLPSSSKNVWVQCGRTVLNLAMKRQWAWTRCFPFCKSKQTNEDLVRKTGFEDDSFVIINLD